MSDDAKLAQFKERLRALRNADKNGPTNGDIIRAYEAVIEAFNAARGTAEQVRRDALEEAAIRALAASPAPETPRTTSTPPGTWDEYAKAAAARLFANPNTGRSAIHVALIEAMRFAAPAASCRREHCGDSCEQTLAERDGNERWANELADAIARHLGIDIGEWTVGMGSAESNNPWQNALLAIDSAAVPGAAGNYADGVHDAAEVFYRMAGNGRTAIYNAINALAPRTMAAQPAADHDNDTCPKCDWMGLMPDGSRCPASPAPQVVRDEEST